MNNLDLQFPDFSDHPPPPQVSLGVYEKWVFEVFARNKRPEMSIDEAVADFMNNEGRMGEFRFID